MVCVESEEKKLDALLNLYNMTTHGQTIIFANRRAKVSWLYEKLKEENFPVCTIHGDMEQYERDSIMNDYRKNKYRILVGTDVVARGIDIRTIALVINYDIPSNCADYIHRVGRSGRFGTSGCAVNIITHDENHLIRKIINYYKIEMHDINKFKEINK
jgi:ATP-dependent RNA helicase